MHWGILAPDTVVSQRRQQNLGLAAAVRHFNDRAVPGIGGMWFPMPILWSVLAISIAEELGHLYQPRVLTHFGRPRSDQALLLPVRGLIWPFLGRQ